MPLIDLVNFQGPHTEAFSVNLWPELSAKIVGHKSTSGRADRILNRYSTLSGRRSLLPLNSPRSNIKTKTWHRGFLVNLLHFLLLSLYQVSCANKQTKEYSKNLHF